MTCAACAAKVENKLNAIENVTATVNFATEKATVTAPSPASVRLLVEEIERAGYGAEVATARSCAASAFPRLPGPMGPAAPVRVERSGGTEAQELAASCLE